MRHPDFSELDLVPEDQMEIHARLDEWGKWVRVGRRRLWKARCASAEGAFRAKVLETPDPKPPMIHIPNAHEIDQVILDLWQAGYKRYMTGLRLYYWKHERPEVMARFCKVKHSQLASVLRVGRRLVMNAVDTGLKTC